MNTRAHVATDYLIGVDVGTSSTKAVAFTIDGRRLATGRAPQTTYVDPQGGVRQDAESWWLSLVDAVSAVVLPESACIGIGITSQIGTHVALGSDLEPIEPAWTWQDGQASVVLPGLEKSVDASALASDLQTWIPSGPTWPIPRMLWLRDHQAKTFERTKFLALPKDYLLYRLTGVFATDSSSWRGLVSPNGEVHSRVLDSLNLPDLVPPRLNADAFAGSLRPHVAERLGLPESVPVFVGSSDYSCALVGAGVHSEGDAFDIGGTSEHLGFLSTSRPTSPNAIAVSYPPADVPGSFVGYGVSSNGGGVTEWLGNVLLPAHSPTNRHAELALLAQQVPAGSDEVLFLPYIRGERSPIWDSAASGAWIGLRSHHGPSHLTRSALEGVAFNLREIRDTLPAMPFGTVLRSTGGTARSDVWNEIKAAVLATPIAVMGELEAGALGAAIYAAIGLGIYPSAGDAMRSMTRVAHVVEPRSELLGIYDAAYDHFQQVSKNHLTSAYTSNRRRTIHA